VGTVGSIYSYVEKKTCEFAVQAARIADIPWTIGAGLAEIGFTLESFTSSSSTLRCSCGWGRLVCVMVQFSHIVGRRSGPLHHLQGTVCGKIETFRQKDGQWLGMKKSPGSSRTEICQSYCSAQEQYPGFALSPLFLFCPAALMSPRHCRLPLVKPMLYGLSNILKRETREG
jgi:hypothetical protein